MTWRTPTAHPSASGMPALSASPISWYRDPCLGSSSGGRRGDGISTVITSSQQCFHWPGGVQRHKGGASPGSPAWGVPWHQRKAGLGGPPVFSAAVGSVASSEAKVPPPDTQPSCVFRRLPPTNESGLRPGRPVLLTPPGPQGSPAAASPPLTHVVEVLPEDLHPALGLCGRLGLQHVGHFLASVVVGDGHAADGAPGALLAGPDARLLPRERGPEVIEAVGPDAGRLGLGQRQEGAQRVSPPTSPSNGKRSPPVCQS